MYVCVFLSLPFFCGDAFCGGAWRDGVDKGRATGRSRSRRFVFFVFEKVGVVVVGRSGGWFGRRCQCRPSPHWRRMYIGYFDLLKLMRRLRQQGNSRRIHCVVCIFKLQIVNCPLDASEERRRSAFSRVRYKVTGVYV